MKIKPIFIYLAVIVLAIIFLLVFTQDANKDAELSSHGMPQDEIHKGLSPGEGSPGPGNVSSEIKHKMDMLEKAYRENPDDTLKAREYADFLAEAHKQNDAVQIYESILKKYPKRTDIRFSLALVHYRNMEYDKAKSIINEVFKYDKENAQAKYNIGAIEASQGNKKEARKIWEELIRKHPDTEIGKMAEESVKALGTI